MLCAISGEVPQEPVVSRHTGTVFEKRLIEKYISEHGTEPGTTTELDIEDLIPLKTDRTVLPRPPSITSVPALLASLQNEWDSTVLEARNLQEQLARTREELATALYQHDAAVRVITRLTKERDEAREALATLTVTQGTNGASAGGDAMMVDPEALPEGLAATVDQTHQNLSKSRKKRAVPEGWATADDVAAFEKLASDGISVPAASSIGIEADYAAIGGLEGDVGIYSLAAERLERSLKVDEPITDTVWTGSKVLFSTSKGSVKVYESGTEVASFAEHAGAVTGVAVHPSGELMASVGSDKSIVLYDLGTLQRVTRIYTDRSLTTVAFHPDGHLLAAGTATGDIKVFMTKTGEQATTFPLGAPVQSVVFSENGYWIAATGKGQTTVTIFDLRKEGDAAVAKTLDIGSVVVSLAWDYSGQFLATAGPAGVTVQHYAKGAKAWKEVLSSATPGVCVRWGEKGRMLVGVDGEGVVSVLGRKE